MTIDEEPPEELSEIDAFPGERRRQITNLFMHAVLLLVMIATVAVLAWVLVYVAGQGLKYLGPEFLTQTPPGNPSQPGGGFLMTWPSQLGLAYRVQWKNSLGDPMWQSIAPDFTGNGSAMNWLDDGSQTGGFTLQRFYRVEVP